jgi:hypothetical protein
MYHHHLVVLLLKVLMHDHIYHQENDDVDHQLLVLIYHYDTIEQVYLDVLLQYQVKDLNQF